MELGLCTSVKNMKKAIDIGYDYIVLSGSEVSALDERSFNLLEDEANRFGIKIKAFNGLCPKEIDMVGPRYSDKLARRYMSKLAERGARLGIRNFGIGAPNSRQVPKGYDRKLAWINGKNFITIVSEECEKYGMIASIESLTYQYCNFINTLEESLVMSSEIDRENIQLIIDFFHIEANGMPLEFASEYIRYASDIHISGTAYNGQIITRPFVNENYAANLRKIALILQDAEYNGTITLEPDAVFDEFEDNAKKALMVMREIMCSDNSILM